MRNFLFSPSAGLISGRTRDFFTHYRSDEIAAILTHGPIMADIQDQPVMAVKVIRWICGEQLDGFRMVEQMSQYTCIFPSKSLLRSDNVRC
jgi:hypothetical protein